MQRRADETWVTLGGNERQILALPERENRKRITGHAIHRCPRQQGSSDEHTLPGGTERGGTCATNGNAERREACGAQTQARPDSAGGRRRRQRRNDRRQCLGWWVHGLPNQTTLRRRQPPLSRGQAWWKSRLACRAVNAWIAASANVRSSSTRSMPGSDNATCPATESGGSSTPKTA